MTLRFRLLWPRSFFLKSLEVKQYQPPYRLLTVVLFLNLCLLPVLPVVSEPEPHKKFLSGVGSAEKGACLYSGYRYRTGTVTRIGTVPVLQNIVIEFLHVFHSGKNDIKKMLEPRVK
jgi:hypothetical protein